MKEKTKIKAEVVADSVDSRGNRLTSMLVVMPRIIIAEINTHRMLSKNTSSSRAIPFKKMLETVQNNPFIPIAWQKNHTGMQGTEYFTEDDLYLPNGQSYSEYGYRNAVDYNREIWLEARDKALQEATLLHNNEVTKQLCNRLLEPFMWTTMLITGSKEGWDNFFNLRCPQYSFGSNTNDPKTWKSKKDAIKDFPDWVSRNDFYWNTINKGQAEIHMMALAECIWDAVNESQPKQLKANEWHLPMIEVIED